MLARNSLLARLAASALSLASSRSRLELTSSAVRDSTSSSRRSRRQLDSAQRGHERHYRRPGCGGRSGDADDSLCRDYLCGRPKQFVSDRPSSRRSRYRSSAATSARTTIGTNGIELVYMESGESVYDAGTRASMPVEDFEGAWQ